LESSTREYSSTRGSTSLEQSDDLVRGILVLFTSLVCLYVRVCLCVCPGGRVFSSDRRDIHSQFAERTEGDD